MSSYIFQQMYPKHILLRTLCFREGRNLYSEIPVGGFGGVKLSNMIKSYLRHNNFTQRNNCLSADFVLKIENKYIYLYIYITSILYFLFPDSRICHRGARQCHICP